MKRPAALLDLDGTLHPRTLGAQMLRELLRAGASRDRAAGAALTAIDAIDGRADQSAAFLTTVDEVYVNYTATVTGLPHPMLIQAASRAWQAERHAVFDFVPVLLAELTARGFVLALISGSPQEVVEEAGSALGIPHCYGARVAVVDGHCQGRLERAPGYPGRKPAAWRTSPPRYPSTCHAQWPWATAHRTSRSSTPWGTQSPSNPTRNSQPQPTGTAGPPQTATPRCAHA